MAPRQRYHAGGQPRAGPGRGAGSGKFWRLPGTEEGGMVEGLWVWGDMAGDLERLEEVLRQIFRRENELVKKAGLHLLAAGGKRVRPAFFLLSARCGVYDPDKLLPAAAALELVHMASLIHDDVVDGADRRRGQETVNRLWGDGTAVLTGDYLFALAFALLAAQPDSSRFIGQMSEVIRDMAAGEIEQILYRCDLGLTEESYLGRIRKKTATFFAVCCALGAMAAGLPPEAAAALRRYGQAIGMAFQIVDDCFDFTGAPELTGKPVGSDLRQGIITLPVIHALAVSPDRAKLAELALALAGGGPPELLAQVNDILLTVRSIEYAQAKATAYLQDAQAAAAVLPAGPARAQLQKITQLFSSRRA